MSSIFSNQKADILVQFFFFAKILFKNTAASERSLSICGILYSNLHSSIKMYQCIKLVIARIMTIVIYIFNKIMQMSKYYQKNERIKIWKQIQ